MGWFSFSRKDKQTSAKAEGAYVARAEESATTSRSKRAAAKTANEPVDPVLPEKKRARRRLVGAIALALAVIIGLPMVLDSEPKPLAGDIAIQIPSKDKPYSAGDAASRPRSSVPAEQALDQGEELVDMSKQASASASASANASSHASAKPSAAAQGTTHLAAEPVTTPAKPRTPDAKPVDGKTGEIKPAEHKPAETKSAETKAAETRAAEVKAAEAKVKAAELKEAELKAAQTKAAEAKARAAELKAAETRAAEAKAAEHKNPENRADSRTETKVAKPEAKPADHDAERAKALLDGNAEAVKPEAKPTKYVVQVAALATQEKIDELQGKLRAAGISSHTQKVATESGTRTRIRVGPFADKEEAAKMREKLIKLGLSGTLIPQ